MDEDSLKAYKKLGLNAVVGPVFVFFLSGVFSASLEKRVFVGWFLKRTLLFLSISSILRLSLLSS